MYVCMVYIYTCMMCSVCMYVCGEFMYVYVCAEEDEDEGEEEEKVPAKVPRVAARRSSRATRAKHGDPQLQAEREERLSMYVCTYV